MHDECHQSLRDIQAFLDGECGADLERAITVHLEHCRPCLHRADFERRLRAVVATKCKDAAPSGLLDRVIARLRAG